MIKTTITKMINSFCYSIAITAMIYTVLAFAMGHVPLLPEYANRFENDAVALLVQLLLIGVMSAVLAGGTVILELERLSLLAQSILYFVISSPVWIAVACFCWGFAKYKASAISVCVSYLVSYVICWVIQYRICKKNIEEINEKINSLSVSEE